MRVNSRFLPAVMATAISAALLACGGAYAADVDSNRLLNADKEPGNWMSYHGSYKSWHYSALDQINAGNVGKLREAWSHVASRANRGLQGMPLAIDGILYYSSPYNQIYALDGDWKGFTPAERAQFTLAKKVAASPVVLTDDDVAAAVKLAGPRDVVQLINYVTLRASFDRITEAAGLRLEK